MKNTSRRCVTRVPHSFSSDRRSQREFRHRGKWSAFFVCLLVAILQFQQGSHALPLTTDALRYFNSFFITGDVVSGGVGLWDTGEGTINVGAAPAGAEPLGAFLYWQVVTSADPTLVDVNAGAEFNGVPLNVPLGTQLKPTANGLLGLGTQACSANGGPSSRVHTFRFDVLSFLDTDLVTGLRVINKAGGYPIDFPGGGGHVLGASLVVLYRSPDPAAKLNAIVIYDGTFVKQPSVTLRQRIEGFYDPASVPGQITYIGGGAQANLGDTLTGPFAATNNLFSGSSGSAWDNVSRTTNSLGGTQFFNTAIAPQNPARRVQRLRCHGRDDLSDRGQRRRWRWPAQPLGDPGRDSPRSEGQPPAGVQRHGRAGRRQGRLHRNRGDVGASRDDVWF